MITKFFEKLFAKQKKSEPVEPQAPYKVEAPELKVETVAPVAEPVKDKPVKVKKPATMKTAKPAAIKANKKAAAKKPPVK